MPQWTKENAAPFIDDALELSLQSVVQYRLYEKCKVFVNDHSGKQPKGKRQKGIARKILQRLNESVGVREENDVEDIEVERSSIVSRMEDFFANATQADSTFLYIYNSESPPQGILSCLNGISGHLDPEKNCRVPPMPGINSSMFYIGSAGSFTEMHVEDSLADSVNLLHAGKEKIWMIIDRDDYTKTNEIVAQNLRDASHDEEREDVSEICALSLHHKNLVLTPSFLDEHKIRYEFVVQKAGDLLYVRYGILHQVVNVGVNIAEAINVGSNEWNFINQLKTICPCERCALIHAATNMDVDMSISVGKVKSRAHRCESCNRVFGTKQLLANHRKDDHDVKHICGICGHEFAHTQSLKYHVRTSHATNVENGIRPNTCTICNKVMKDLDRHTRLRHLKLVECPECKTNFTRHDLAQHIQTCVKFTCADCAHNFKSSRALSYHRTRWCKNPFSQ